MNLAIPRKFIKNYDKCYNYRNVLGKISLFLSEPNANTLVVVFYQDNKSELIFFYHLLFRQTTLENDVFFHTPLDYTLQLYVFFEIQNSIP